MDTGAGANLANVLSGASENKVAATYNKFARANNQRELELAAKEFEAVFISQMIRHMFNGTEADPLFGGGSGEETFTQLLQDEYGKIISKSGGLGMADHVIQEFLKLQEGGR